MLTITVRKILFEDIKNKNKISLLSKVIEEKEDDLDSVKRKLFKTQQDKKNTEVELNQAIRDVQKYYNLYQEQKSIADKWITPRDKKTGKFIPKTKKI
jgi:uncharacterized protein Yka (UPF0111/DUF47 family)